MTDDPTPAHVAGYGPIPAGVARDLVRDTKAEVWVRRVYTSLADGSQVTMESRRRCFDGQLRRLIVLRDQFWPNPVVRRPDPARRPRPNGRRGWRDEQAPGWSAVPDSRAGPHTLTITNPTGATYRSRAPDPPGAVELLDHRGADGWVQVEPGRWVLAA